MHKLRASEGMGGLLAVLLFVALSLRLLVPTGYMPTRAADGLVISLCGGQGAAQVAISLTGTGDIRVTPGDDDVGSRGSAASCAFAALAAPALQPTAAPIVWIAASLTGEIALPLPAPLLLISAAFVRPPLRGPPGAA